MEVRVIARKWGGSLAVLLPKNVVEAKNIQENEEITIEVKKEVLANEFFGTLKGVKINTQKIKDEMRKGW